MSLEEYQTKKIKFVCIYDIQKGKALYVFLGQLICKIETSGANKPNLEYFMIVY